MYAIEYICRENPEAQVIIAQNFSSIVKENLKNDMNYLKVIEMTDIIDPIIENNKKAKEIILNIILNKLDKESISSPWSKIECILYIILPYNIDYWNDDTADKIHKLGVNENSILAMFKFHFEEKEKPQEQFGENATPIKEWNLTENKSAHEQLKEAFKQAHDHFAQYLKAE